MAHVIIADLDEMVFEDRERSYGAYQLRRDYPRHLGIGLTIISTLALLLIFSPMIARNLGWLPKEALRGTLVDLKPEVIPPQPEEDKTTIKPPPPPEEPVPLKSISFQIPEPTPDAADTSSIHEIEVLQAAPNISLKDVAGVDDVIFRDEVTDEIPNVIVDQTPPDDFFIVPEEEPRAVNLSEVWKLIRYPQMAIDANIQGTVVVRILVDKKGNYQKHKLIASVHPLLSTEVERHIHQLKFTPAIQGGKPIAFWVNVPFRFHFVE
ncbi:MAG: energy transducer TonB [Bacteroidetes bacterium]|nr:MAG: energy transducer TonB [Bacteroidota bacterium]